LRKHAIPGSSPPWVQIPPEGKGSAGRSAAEHFSVPASKHKEQCTRIRWLTYAQGGARPIPRAGVRKLLVSRADGPWRDGSSSCGLLTGAAPRRAARMPECLASTSARCTSMGRQAPGTGRTGQAGGARARQGARGELGGSAYDFFRDCFVRRLAKRRRAPPTGLGAAECPSSHATRCQRRNIRGWLTVHLYVAAEGTVSPGLTYSLWGRSFG
jgi:hypothetical protein